MKFIDEFRDPELGRRLVDDIHHKADKPMRLMEFCGGHTVSIFRNGIRQLLPSTVEMLSGPGCPVCVTANSDLDKAIALAHVPGVIITTFGDMLKVPGSTSSLMQARADGADVRIVYSTLDALQIAKNNPDKSVVFIGIGFETTAPGIAASILQADAESVPNYYVLSQHKLCPPTIKALLDLGEVKLDGIVCPGHVCAIIGSDAWNFVAKDYGIGCVVSGFEPIDILKSIDMLIDQVEKGAPAVEIAYKRGVTPAGNTYAIEQLYRVFEEAPADWRGIGIVPGSGLVISKKYEKYDAEKNFDFDPGPTIEPKGCLCGNILRGVNTPLDCKLFKKVCTPDSPVGPCMVSAEGTCSAYYLYGGGDD